MTLHSVYGVYSCLNEVGPCPTTSQEYIWAHVHVPCPSSGPFTLEGSRLFSVPKGRAPLISLQIENAYRVASWVNVHHEKKEWPLTSTSGGDLRGKNSQKTRCARASKPGLPHPKLAALAPPAVRPGRRGFGLTARARPSFPSGRAGPASWLLRKVMRKSCE